MVWLPNFRQISNFCYYLVPVALKNKKLMQIKSQMTSAEDKLRLGPAFFNTKITRARTRVTLATNAPAAVNWPEQNSIEDGSPVDNLNSEGMVPNVTT